MEGKLIDMMPRDNNCRRVPISDFGPKPYVVNISQAACQNTNYRRALWTGSRLQVTLMCIPPKGEIGLEVHHDTDQFLRIEKGTGTVLMGPSKNNLNYRNQVCDGFAVFVPAGTWHNMVNTGNCPMKIYTVYAPPHHPHGTVEETKETDDCK